MKKSNFILVTFLNIMLFFTLISETGCAVNPSADDVEQRKQAVLQQEATREAGMPNITNFTEKKMAKMIYELRDNPKLINYAYLQSDYTGKLIYIGKCIGFGLPYATQYSNPQKVVSNRTQVFGTLPQAEPNGLFMPASAEGTWLMLVDTKDNQPKIAYFEPRVVVSPFKLKF